MSFEDSVGYKKPPKAYEWKPGQSGNPSGKSKSKKLKPLQVVWAEVLATLVPVVEKGKNKKMLPLQEVLIRKFVQQALEGKPAQMKLVQEVMKSLPPDLVEKYHGNLTEGQLNHFEKILSAWGKDKSSAAHSPPSSISVAKKKKGKAGE
jgi:hypothetical protein